MNTRDTKHIIKTAVASAIGSLVLSCSCWAQKAPDAKTGLAAILASDDAVISELVKRDMTTLKEHLYAKNKLTPEQKAAFEAIAVYKRLTDPKLKPKEAASLAGTVALGTDKLITTMKRPEDVLNLAASLAIAGASRPMNMLEYWGEDPKMQAQLRPVAEAIVRAYLIGIKMAEEKRATLEKQMNQSAAAAHLSKQWEDMENLVFKSKYNAACSYYPLALSIDRADSKRIDACTEGLKLIAEYEDAQYEIQPAVRINMGKFFITKGTREAVTEGKKKLAEVVKDPKANWGQKFEATYFNAIADLANRDVAAAKASTAALEKWLADNAQAGGDGVKGAKAAVEMLKYRAHSLAAEVATKPKDKETANAAAIAVLQQLQKDRPDLGGIINQQLISRLPAEPNMEDLNGLLLQALMGRGYDEAVKEADQPADERTLKQGIAAAQEIMKRAAAKKDNLTPREAAQACLVLGLSFAKQGNDFAASKAFLDHMEQFKDSPDREAAFTYAQFHVGKLQQTQGESPIFKDLQLRFLELATAPPFSRPEYFFAYGDMLLKRVVAVTTTGKFDAAQKKQLIDDTQRAIALFRKTADPRRIIFARFREMVGYDQLIDLDPTSPKMREWVGRIKILADEVTKLIDAGMPSADEATKQNYRLHRAKTVLMVVDLSKHDKTLLPQAVEMTKDIDKIVEGLPNREAFLAIALYNRVNALLSLNRTDEAMASLAKLLETYSADKALDIIISMVEALEGEFKQALNRKDDARADELAGHLAKVSGYLVDAARKSTNPEIKKNLPKYVIFEAHFHKVAGDREKDPTRKRAQYTQAMEIYQALLKQKPEDKSLQLGVANIQFDLGDYRPAQSAFGALVPFIAKWLPAKELGQPQELNPQFFEVNFKLLKSMSELCKAKTDGFDDKVLANVKTKLQQIFIMWGANPGGPEWGPAFNELRKELLPDWVVPATIQLSLETALPSTQPATAPAAQP